MLIIQAKTTDHHHLIHYYNFANNILDCLVRALNVESFINIYKINKIIFHTIFHWYATIMFELQIFFVFWVFLEK